MREIKKELKEKDGNEERGRGGGNRLETDVLGRRAEGLPVRDVGIASLDALDFVPAVAFHPAPEGEPAEKKKRKRETSDRCI